MALAIEWIEYQPGVLEGVEAKFGDNAERYGRMLHSWMRHRLRGTARTWNKYKDSSHGLQTWRDMLGKYDPSTGASLLDLQQRIRIVRCAKALGEVPSMIDKFESDYRHYMKRVGQCIDDLTRQHYLVEYVA